MKPLLVALLSLVSFTALAQESPDVRVTKINLVWHELEPENIPRTCISFYGVGGPLVQGCYIRRGDECHIYTAVVRSPYHFKTVGHELFHCNVGLFHSGHNAEWVIPPLPLPEEKPRNTTVVQRTE